MHASFNRESHKKEKVGCSRILLLCVNLPGKKLKMSKAVAVLMGEKVRGVM